MTVKNDIIKELKGGELAVFEIAHNINREEMVVRNEIHSMKEKGIIEETGNFKKKDSSRGYKVYRLNPKKLNEQTNPEDTEILKAMILPFAENNLNVPLKPEQLERIKVLAKEVIPKEALESDNNGRKD